MKKVFVCLATMIAMLVPFNLLANPTLSAKGNAYSGKILAIKCIATYPVCRIVFDKPVSGPGCSGTEIGLEVSAGSDTKTIVSLLISARLGEKTVGIWIDGEKCWRGSLPLLREIQL